MKHTLLYDTNVFIDFLRGDQASQEYLNKQPTLHCSIITAAELIQGAKNIQSKKETKRLIARLTIIKLTPASSSIMYTLIEEFYQSKGLRIPDGLIAASALDNNFDLVTDNIKDYSFIPNLHVIPWKSLLTRET